MVDEELVVVVLVVVWVVVELVVFVVALVVQVVLSQSCVVPWVEVIKLQSHSWSLLQLSVSQLQIVALTPGKVSLTHFSGNLCPHSRKVSFWPPATVTAW